MKKILLFLFIQIAMPICSSGAVEIPHKIAGNDHLKLMNYNPAEIHSYTGFFGFQSSLLFEKGEVIDVVSMGESSGWQFLPRGNRLFLKPIGDNAETNATIITNKRVYQFEFHADDATGLEDPRLAYEVRLVYSNADAGLEGQGISALGNQNDVPDPSSEDIARKGLNFNYSLAHYRGSTSILPVKVFDDGKFTYVEFKKQGSEIPSFFSVDAEGYESLINFHVQGRYVIIESVEALFTLRLGSKTACLFNDNEVDS